MWRSVGALIGASIAAFVLAACTGGAPPLPPAQADAARSEREKQAFVGALKPHRAGRPVVAVLALNEGTEMTDLLLPHAVLERADVAEVRIVAPRSGRVSLYPALEVDGAQDFASFDRSNPSGADYVIVPAMIADDNPAVAAWLKQQAARGARVIGVCSGARVVGRAGLLDGRRFAGHWYDRGTLLKRHAGATYVPHQRYVMDRGVATTTGITASVPTMLALVEAIGGQEKAKALAAELGVASWTPAHDSSPFHLDAGRRADFLLNKAAFWRGERWRVDVQDGADDIALALAVDAWTRTGHVSVDAASASGPVRLRSGLVLLAQPPREGASRLLLSSSLRPVPQLDRTLCEIGERYGASRRDWVMQEMEYPGPVAACTG
ncbi:ThiJ/PfpI domain-containing protein [Variovorax paradoxus B4]|uniref:ThiJ/PfpI domain-containing protein n=1 Tax=Variovorax paradoxus B4 TaxID=1246301 RepID=T1XF24_VARPD|nr:DJ-1/PfpI family protein [Variovorax paradoxus]AGU51091.1 ThiJ/PfpI domain-containing protein [Variovorax paradoxus B4]